jgi:5-deoxy-glucuronate isomerase
MEPGRQDGLDELRMKSRLLVKASANETGTYQEITAKQAGWKHLNFGARRMERGESWEGYTGGCEYAIVLLGGEFSIQSYAGDWKTVNGRKDVFSGLPHAVYLPRETRFSLTPESPLLDIAWGYCESDHEFPARMISPEDVDAMGIEIRGGDNATRQINSILPPGAECHRLVCVEVYTPSGNWSSFPAHKHDQRTLDDQGNLIEACLEEVYFYKIDKPQGFAIQRVYNDDRSLDELVLAEGDDVVLVPSGYHPVVAGHGYTAYYLNFLVGSDQSLANTDDPAHKWIYDSWEGLDPRVPVVTLEMNGRKS